MLFVKNIGEGFTKEQDKEHISAEEASASYRCDNEQRSRQNGNADYVEAESELNAGFVYA